MKAFVDRIEGEVAVVLIGRKQWDLPAALLPAGVVEGDTVELSARRSSDPRPQYDDFDWKAE
jgi:hypothetical protein